MKSTKKNMEIVTKIIELMAESNLTADEAYGILDYTRGRIPYASKVAKKDSLHLRCKFEDCIEEMLKIMESI